MNLMQSAWLPSFKERMMRKINRWLRSGVITLTMMGLTACAIQQSNQKNADAAVKKTQDLYDNHQVVAPKTLVTKSDQVFLTNNHFLITPKQKLPPVFNQRLVYSTGANETLSQTFANIAKLTRVPVVFADDTQTKAAMAVRNTAGVMTYQGTLSQVVGQLVNRSGLFWTYKDGKIHVFLLETKIYPLDAPIGSFDTDSTISSTSDSSGGGSSSSSGPTVGGNSAINLKYSVKADSPWTAALTTLKDMLSPAGKLQGNPVEGYVAITDNPDVQTKVADYIQRINEKTNKKIAVRIDVYNVLTSATSAYGLDMNAFVGVLSDQATIVTNPSAQSTTDFANVSTMTFQAASDSTHNAVLNALNTLGKTSQVTGATIYTISGQPAPIQSVKEETYLASMSTTTTTDAGTTTSLTPGTVVTGYSMMVTPKIEANNQIMVTLNLQLSTLLGMKTLSSGTTSTGEDSTTNTIQGPEVASKNFLENMVLHSGQSLLIAGFQDDTGSSETSSPTSTDFWLAGGGKTTAKEKTTTVIVVTPYIIGD